MEEKKIIGSNYGILVIFMFAIICTLTDFIIIDSCLRKYASKSGISTEDKSSSSNIVNNVVSSDSKFKAYVTKLKSERKVINDDNVFLSSTVEGSNNIDVKFYTVNLSIDGELSVSFVNDGQDYDTRTIASDVLGYSVLYSGNGGFRGLYIIFDDGTVGFAGIEHAYVNGEEIIVKKDKDLKNIISIVQGSFNDGLSGSYGAIYIDIDGNMFK